MHSISTLPQGLSHRLFPTVFNQTFTSVGIEGGKDTATSIEGFLLGGVKSNEFNLMKAKLWRQSMKSVT
jgi:hypothetical protein